MAEDVDWATVAEGVAVELDAATDHFRALCLAGEWEEATMQLTDIRNLVGVCWIAGDRMTDGPVDVDLEDVT